MLLKLHLLYLLIIYYELSNLYNTNYIFFYYKTTSHKFYLTIKYLIHIMKD